MNFLEKEKFDPGIISLFFHPFYFVRKEIMAFLKKNSQFLYGHSLDFGGGSNPYLKIFPKLDSIISLEVYNDKKIKYSDSVVFYDGLNIPFAENTFDSILCTEVFEHVKDLEKVFDELYRVLKPSGHIIITTPFMCMEHEMPNDYRRISFNGLQNMLKEKNFKIVKQIKLVNSFHLILQTFNFYICQLFLKKKRKIYIKFLVYFFICGPVNLLSLTLNLFFPRIEEMYFGTGVLAIKNK